MKRPDFHKKAQDWFAEKGAPDSLTVGTMLHAAFDLGVEAERKHQREQLKPMDRPLSEIALGPHKDANG